MVITSIYKMCHYASMANSSRICVVLLMLASILFMCMRKIINENVEQGSRNGKRAKQYDSL